MRPFALHMVFLGRELAISFGDHEETEEVSDEVLPCLSETEVDRFGFAPPTDGYSSAYLPECRA